ncbi:unnamed protein product [Penicillium roqueforti FM164]|uniref:Genomic scaffold, ProqFM164S01 n=1 Tax=Penicillium roqueforti (strain FM164) TaxID=1365484 RepID=W6PWK0_PENRF|nr:unnamed protein product [Penicillium roqueforti FM164]
MSSSDVRCPLPTKVACASTEQSRLLSLGSRFLLKERGRESPSHEVIDTHFIKENTTFPRSHNRAGVDRGRVFQIVERVPGPGVPLEEICWSIPQPDRERLLSIWGSSARSSPLRFR